MNYSLGQKHKQRTGTPAFEVTIRVRNNLLKQRRDRLGLSQKRLAEMIGISLWGYGALEGLHRPPVTLSGIWRRCALSIAAFYEVKPEELWPDEILAVERSTVVRQIHGPDLLALASQYQEDAALPPGRDLDQAELKETVENVLKTLSPREASVLREKFGLDGEDPQVNAEIAQRYGVSTARLWQIERKAFRKLLHPSRAKLLHPWLDGIE